MAAAETANSELRPSGDGRGTGERLIGGTLFVDVGQRLADAGGGSPAFAVVDRSGGRGGLMALHMRAAAPARAAAINTLLPQPPEGVLAPVAQGLANAPPGEQGLAWYVLCQAPPGPAIWSAGASAIRPWAEADLLEHLLRPAALALEQLRLRNVTHRSVRPDNIFRAGPREAVVLGAAWAAPPASLQPAIFEPPYSAMCLPAGRGDGSIADDVYALGVTLLAMALGRLPMQGLDDAEIVRRKLELGSFTALAGEERLPAIIADLARGMLAEDPEHRPPPMLLADPLAARARRVAARPPRRAQRTLEIGANPVWTARTLAFAIAREPEQGVRQLRAGAVDRWIRRGLGDPLLATRLEEAVRLRGGEAQAAGEDQRSDALLVMRAVAVLDPLAPLCWRGLVFWPDGLGPALAAAEPAAPAPGESAAVDPLQQIVASEAIAAWGAARPERCDAAMLRLEAQQHRNLLRLRGWGGGMARLRYALNPLLPCRSPLLAAQIVVRLSDLLGALEAVAARPEARRQPPLDREIAAFMAARHETRIEAELVTLAEARSADASGLVQLRLLAGLQAGRAPRPALAAWLAELVAPMLSRWSNLARRKTLQQGFAEMVSAGQLQAMLEMLEDPATRETDARELGEAMAVMRRLQAELLEVTEGGAGRREVARRISQELVAGVGAVALTVAAVAALLS